METIDTMVRNAKTLSEANIDWSLDAGPIWLIGMVVAWTLFIAFVNLVEAARR